MPRRRSSEEEDEEEEERPQRNAANARERARMRVLSRAFCRLKTTLPWVPADTKLSKLDTLRLATSYIAHLSRVLHGPPNQQLSPNPLSMTWPFTFQPQKHEEPQEMEHTNYMNNYYNENAIQI